MTGGRRPAGRLAIVVVALGTAVAGAAVIATLLLADDTEHAETPADLARTAAGPTLVASQPADGAVDVDPQAGVRLQFDTALGDGGPIDATFTPVGSAADGSAGAVAVAAADGSISIDLTRQNLTLAPAGALAPETGYRLVVTGLVTTDGRPLEPVRIGFTTGAVQAGSDRFEVIALASTPGVTGVTFGPAGHAYATTIGGEIVRFDLGADGLPTGERSVVVANPDFQFIAMDFEPGAPERVWVSQWRNDPPDEFSSEIAAYDLAVGAASEVKKVVGLPRHPNGNHSVQGLDFAGDHLYAAVGSVTAGGARSDTFFGDPVLEENPISAAIIEIDHRLIAEPVDVAAIDIGVSSDPVRLFATGTRNAFDLVWHGNGNLYANVNQNGGSSDENSAPPTTGPCQGLPSQVATNRIADTLVQVERGRYYGHPNPSRGECVVMGGGQGPFAVDGYEADQPPEPAFDETLLTSYHSDRAGSFGISVNGIDEYRGGGPLQGALLSADFAGSRSILVVRLGEPTTRLVVDGPIERLATADGTAATFVHPIDVASSETGHLLVADFGEWLGDRIGDGGGVFFLRALDR